MEDNNYLNNFTDPFIWKKALCQDDACNPDRNKVHRHHIDDCAKHPLCVSEKLEARDPRDVVTLLPTPHTYFNKMFYGNED